MLITRVARHRATRVNISTDGDGLRRILRRIRKCRTFVDMHALNKITARRGSWDEVRAAVASNAPNGLLIFAAIDATPLMAIAGHQTKAVEYLLGNHVIAEQMFRKDPLACSTRPCGS
jgi:hypothetical protein